MGVSVRTPRVRYTEWRDWKTGDTVAREVMVPRIDIVAIDASIVQ